MVYTVLKMYSYGSRGKRYVLNPGDPVTLVKDHMPEDKPFGDKARYKEYRDKEGREFIVFSGDFAKFVEKK